VVAVLRLTRFSDEWSTLENWFDQLSVLQLVDASAAPDDVATAVETIIQQCLVKDATPQVSLQQTRSSLPLQ